MSARHGRAEHPELRFARRILFLLAGLWLVLVGLVWLFQRRLQYFPDPSDVPLPGGPGRAELEDVRLEAADGTRLRAWSWPGTRGVTLLILHGNAGHRGDRLEWAERLHRRGWGVFLLDYRGYGGSSGSPTEAGLLADAEAAAAWLEARERRVVYFGESIGCGVAVGLAARRPPAGLILQSGFTSAVDVARRAYPFLPVGLLMRDRFECREAIASLNVPLLSIHGERDTVVPLELGRALFEAANEPKRFLALPAAGHNDLARVGGAAYDEAIDAFLTGLEG